MTDQTTSSIAHDGQQDCELKLTHFGAAGWSITDGQTVILLDPYLSRIRFTGRRFGPHDATVVPGDERPVVSMDDVPPIDTATIDANSPHADYLLLSHSHFNHCMDVPYIAKRTGAVVIGSESTMNVAMNGGVPPTDPNARTGLLTPPGMTRFARAKSFPLSLRLRATSLGPPASERLGLGK